MLSVLMPRQGLGAQVAALVHVDGRRIGNTLQGAPVLPPDALFSLSGTVIRAAAGRGSARTGIRRYPAATGRQEGRDLVAVA